jgi:hypothetical protein
MDQWNILGPDEDTGSDHKAIEWTFDSGQTEINRNKDVKGWNISNLLLDKPTNDQAREVWGKIAARRPILTDESPVAQLEEEAEWIQDLAVKVLDQFCKKIRACARSKRWWNESIEQRRKALGRAKRRRRSGHIAKAEVKVARRELRREIRQARRRTWEEFLEAAAGTNVWSVMSYTKPMRESTVPTIRDSLNNIAHTHEDKAKMLAEMAFPAPVPYQGGEGTPGSPGKAYTQVDEELVRECLFRTATNKAPGPDRLGNSVIRLVWEWDKSRIAALVRASIRLGTHPRAWKVARGVTIPKPGKDDYTLAKSYRVISLLNCLGKLVEKTVATMIGGHMERENKLHEGQYGCRKKRSAVDAVGVLMSEGSGGVAGEEGSSSPVHGRGSCFPECGEGMPVAQDEERWTGRKLGEVDGQFHAG